jgi:hypothetical protein
MARLHIYTWKSSLPDNWDKLKVRFLQKSKAPLYLLNKPPLKKALVKSTPQFRPKPVLCPSSLKSLPKLKQRSRLSQDEGLRHTRTEESMTGQLLSPKVRDYLERFSVSSPKLTTAPKARAGLQGSKLAAQRSPRSKISTSLERLGAKRSFDEVMEDLARTPHKLELIQWEYQT